MRESIGSVFLYNIVFIFLAIIFSFLMGTLIYHRAFKINNRIISVIEKYEGYNKYAIKEIDDQLADVGYPTGWDKDCPDKRKGYSLENTPAKHSEFKKNYKYCVYYIGNDGADSKGTYYSYGVVTYISFDIPIIGAFLKIPIYTESNRIFKF